MRIAFDVKGTIDGPKGPVIIEAFKELQRLGHECVVWSNLYTYAVNAIADYDLKAEARDKLTKYDLRDRGLEPFDVAIEDDRSQTWLGASRLIFVDEITDAASLVESITTGEG